MVGPARRSSSSARRSGAGSTGRRHASAACAIDARLAQHGFATVLVLRLLLCMTPPLNFALGATRVRWRDYVLGTAIGITPGIALGAYLGDAVTSAESWTALVHPTLLLPVLLGVALMIGGGRASRRLFGSEPSR